MSEPNTVDPVTVIAPSWGWGYVSFFSGVDMAQSSEPSSTQAYAAEYAAGSVHSESSHADAATYEQVAENVVADLIVMGYRQNTNLTIDGPGFTQNMTGNQLVSTMQRVDILITDEDLSQYNGAVTKTTLSPDGDPNKTTWQIKINPAQANGRFADPQAAITYVIFHELGHATPGAAALSLALGINESQHDAWDKQIMEQFANSMGAELAKAIGFPYPIGALEAGQYNGLLAPGFSGPFSGTAGADNLIGAAGDDVVAGFGGNDVLVATTGNDYLVGGDGIDTVSYANAGGGVYVDLAVVPSNTGSMGTDYITEVENLTGSAYADNLNGNAASNAISAGSGDDIVWGFGGADSLHGNAGNDTLQGGQGSDTVQGGQNDDVIRGGQNDDVLLGDAGNDWISGDAGNDTETGGLGADTFSSFGGAGLDRITDFNYAEGDRVRLDPGSTYSVAQVGADTVVSITGGAQVVLANVSMGSLGSGWIFVG